MYVYCPIILRIVQGTSDQFYRRFAIVRLHKASGLSLQSLGGEVRIGRFPAIVAYALAASVRLLMSFSKRRASIQSDEAITF